MLKGLHYFVSDVHLGLRASDPSLVERRFLGFLDSLPSNIESLYLLGDIFDFWYEYKYVIPRGHTRVLGRLASLCDSGVKVYMFRGNHDIWLYDYFQNEIGIKVLDQPYEVQIGEKRFCLGHGDGLGETPIGFRIIRWAFRNRFLQTLFSSIHPRWAMGLGYAWSRNSRLAKGGDAGQAYSFKGEEEPVCRYALSYPGKIDYFVFGHLHTPVDFALGNGSRLCILGDWTRGCEYAVYDGATLSLNKYSSDGSHF
jgi:UDP-2,3-diacylglucosamine hydrolase